MSAKQLSIPELLVVSRVIAVVGLSANPNRPSYEVAEYMQEQGYRIIPVNPTYEGTTILGEYCYPSLGEAAAALAEEGVSIDIVDCFRRSEAIEEIADQAIAIGARCLWMQEGVFNQAAATKAIKAGITVFMDNCLKVEHMRWELARE